MDLINVRAGQYLTSDDFDRLICCGHPMRVGHATNALPIAGAVCETCWCAVTSRPTHGPAVPNRCQQHR